MKICRESGWKYIFTQKVTRQKIVAESYGWIESCCILHMRMPLKEAVDRAVDECIKEYILADFLRKNRAEVVNVSIFEYDEEFHMGIIRAEEREEGIAIGIREGEKRANQNSALHMIKRGKLPLEEIAEYTSLSLEEVKKLAQQQFPQ